MKIILSCLFLFFSVCATAQRNGLTDKDLKDLAGNWSGTLTYTDYSDDKTHTSLPTQLVIVDLKDSLGLNFTYTEPNGKKVTDKSSLRIYEDGDKLNIDGHVYFIAAVRRKGIRLTIIAENEGEDNNKAAEIRQTIIIGPSILNILKEVRYTGMKDYFIRSKTELQKK